MHPLLAIVGPTGVGKTNLSIALAKALDADIISADAMQFYRGMDIGTAKITQDQQAGVKHHLLDILAVDESFSVAEYQRMVRTKIDALLPQKPVILVGGSGLYLKSVLYHYQFKGPKRSTSIANLKDCSLEDLQQLLQKKAPELYAHIDLANKRRVLRALEKSDDDIEDSGDQLYYPKALVFALHMPRKILYQRIDERVDQMIVEGLVEEAKTVYQKDPSPTARQAIGYKELFRFFEGETDLLTAIDTIKLKTRRYAKKQYTWFRHQMDCHWIEVDPDHPEKTFDTVMQYLKTNKKDI